MKEGEGQEDNLRGSQGCQLITLSARHRAEEDKQFCFAKLDDEEKEPKREKGKEQRKDASLLCFSSAGSLLASALVDHVGKQVNAAALLLWALVADRYIFNDILTK